MTTRRTFLKTTALSAAATAVPYFSWLPQTIADESQAKNDRPLVGCIGNGGMGRGDATAAKRYGELVAFCDVDKSHVEGIRNDPNIGAGKGDTYEDYRQLLDRQDIDIVTISTPDHWHTKIALDALRAGKDIYVQKPLTLTIEEGQQLCKAVRETGRVVQVGTQQRSEANFQTAMALAREGRIGKIKRVTVAIGGAPKGTQFKRTDPPAGLNWDAWLGQTPKVEYIKERCHADFRWWYEYSGGKMTDWGAHHVDIAQWGIGMEESGPTAVEFVAAEHPVPFKNGLPTVDDTFNAATTFNVRCVYPSGVEMLIRDNAPDLGFDNGVMFEGEKGRYFVNRGKLTGKPVEDLATNPLPAEALTKLRRGKNPGDHMANLFACVRDRSLPISDVYSHHRILTTCHLANIAIRLGRSLKWDPEAEQIVGDDEARAMQRREQRKGFETA